MARKDEYQIVDIKYINPNWSDITFWVRPKSCPWIKEPYKAYVSNGETVYIVRPSFGENWNAGWKWLAHWPLFGCGAKKIKKILDEIHYGTNFGRSHAEMSVEFYKFTVKLRKLEKRHVQN